MDDEFLLLAVELASRNVREGRGGPFGAVVVKDGRVIGEGRNEVTATRDPTAHAEIQAIRQACQTLGTFQLDGCEVYSSCEPCPMCLGAIYWARPAAVHFVYAREDAAAAGFDDAFIYDEFSAPRERRTIPVLRRSCRVLENPFTLWSETAARVPY